MGCLKKWPLGYSPPQVDRICGIWGPYNILKAIFYLCKGDYALSFMYTSKATGEGFG